MPFVVSSGGVLLRSRLTNNKILQAWAHLALDVISIHQEDLRYTASTNMATDQLLGTKATPNSAAFICQLQAFPSSVLMPDVRPFRLHQFQETLVWLPVFRTVVVLALVSWFDFFWLGWWHDVNARVVGRTREQAGSSTSCETNTVPFKMSLEILWFIREIAEIPTSHFTSCAKKCNWRYWNFHKSFQILIEPVVHERIIQAKTFSNSACSVVQKFILDGVLETVASLSVM